MIVHNIYCIVGTMKCVKYIHRVLNIKFTWHLLKIVNDWPTTSFCNQGSSPQRLCNCGICIETKCQHFTFISRMYQLFQLTCRAFKLFSIKVRYHITFHYTLLAHFSGDGGNKDTWSCNINISPPRHFAWWTGVNHRKYTTTLGMLLRYGDSSSQQTCAHGNLRICIEDCTIPCIIDEC